VYGRSECLGCKGTGKKAPCAHCKGTGKNAPCLYCRGTGTRPPCTDCKGTGRTLVCARCSGTGKKPPCIACKGKGLLACPACARPKTRGITAKPIPTTQDKKAPKTDKTTYWPRADEKDQQPKALDVRGYYRNESTYVRMYYDANRQGPTSVWVPRVYITGQVVEDGSYYDEFFKRTGRPRAAYVPGYYRRNGSYVHGQYRAASSVMGVPRRPAVSPHGRPGGYGSYHGRSGPTTGRPRTFPVRGYYRMWTLPRWYIRSY